MDKIHRVDYLIFKIETPTGLYFLKLLKLFKVRLLWTICFCTLFPLQVKQKLVLGYNLGKCLCSSLWSVWHNEFFVYYKSLPSEAIRNILVLVHKPLVVVSKVLPITLTTFYDSIYSYRIIWFQIRSLFRVKEFNHTFCINKYE